VWVGLAPVGRRGGTGEEGGSCLRDGSSLSAAMHELSERAKERQEVHLLPGRERREPIACRAPLTVVREDRVLDRARAPVVQEGGQEPKAPERRGTHLATGRFSLLDAVAQTSHVVDQEIGIRLEGTESQGRDIARAGPERANVAVRAPDLLEKAAPFIRAIRPPAVGEVPTGSNVDLCGRWGEKAHEVRKPLDIFEVVIDPRYGITGEQATVTLRAVLVR